MELEGTTSRITRIITTVNQSNDKLEQILQPVVNDILAGHPIGMPTETVYGLAANALDSDACRRIYETKNRPADNPLIVHISSWNMLKGLVKSVKDVPPFHHHHSSDISNLAIPPFLKPVLQKFWPGPLTVLLPKKETVNDIVTAGLDTVAIRFPNHPIAKKLIDMAGVPLAAPSANLSGRPSPTTAQHVWDDLGGRINYIVDGGSSGFGIESTVLDATRNPPLILRPGSITQKMLQEFLPKVEIFNKNMDKHLSVEEVEQMMERPSTPGMKYKHYSPANPVLLFSPKAGVSVETVNTAIINFIDSELKSGHRIARISLKPTNPPIINENYFEFPLSQDGNQIEMAKNLFAALRATDAFKPFLIIAQAVKEEDEGLAIMNRLSKAASFIRTISN